MLDVLKVRLKHMNNLVCSVLSSELEGLTEILSTWIKLYLKVQNTHGTFV